MIVRVGRQFAQKYGRSMMRTIFGIWPSCTALVPAFAAKAALASAAQEPKRGGISCMLLLNKTLC